MEGREVTKPELDKEAEKRFDDEFGYLVLSGAGLPYCDVKYIRDRDERIKALIAQEKQLSKQEERAKVKKIASDYQSFKINVLELEMKLCDYIEKGKDDE